MTGTNGHTQYCESLCLILDMSLIYTLLTLVAIKEKSSKRLDNKESVELRLNESLKLN